jgi:hypothetical protein
MQEHALASLPSAFMTQLIISYFETFDPNLNPNYTKVSYGNAQ